MRRLSDIIPLEKRRNGEEKRRRHAPFDETDRGGKRGGDDEGTRRC